MSTGTRWPTLNLHNWLGTDYVKRTEFNENFQAIDNFASLVPVMADVRAATTANITLSATQTVDGVVLAVGDRVLVKNQTTTSQNGIYDVQSGSWTRSIDCDTSAKVKAGLRVYVEEGTTNAKKAFRMSNTGVITIETTGLTFDQIDGAGAVTDTTIGSRTVNDAIAIGTTDTDTLTNLLSKYGAQFRALSGKADWYTAPAITLETISSRLNQAVNTTSAPTFAGATSNGDIVTARTTGTNQWSYGLVLNGKDGAGANAISTIYGSNLGELLLNYANGTTNKVLTKNNSLDDGTGAMSIKGAFSLDSQGSAANSYSQPIYLPFVNSAGTKVTNHYLQSRPDGRILHSVNGIGSLLADCTTENLTYYVDGTLGSDTASGQGTGANAFKTIAKAISMIPPIVNHIITINVAAGTYNESGGGVTIAGYSGSGVFNLVGAGSTTNTHKISYLGLAKNTCKVQVYGFNLTITNQSAFYVEGCSNVYATNLKIDGVSAANVGLFCDSSNVYINTSEISNRYEALYAHVNGNIFAQSMSGSNNQYRCFASYGGKVVLDGGTLPGSTSGDVSQQGGIVSTNGKGATNAWGENSYQTGARTYVLVQANNSQALSGAGVQNKLTFGSVPIDPLGEWDSTNSRYVWKSKYPGVILVSAGVAFSNMTAGMTVTLSVFKNGTLVGLLDERQIPYNNVSQSARGCVAFSMGTNEYIEIFAQIDGSGTFSVENTWTFGEFIRVA